MDAISTLDPYSRQIVQGLNVSRLKPNITVAVLMNTVCEDAAPHQAPQFLRVTATSIPEMV